MTCANTFRQAEGREAEPSAGIVDSQSLRAAETMGAASRGYDAGKKVQGRKRSSARGVDTRFHAARAATIPS